MKLKAFKAALPHTIPICIGFLFVGTSYGLLMNSMGFGFILPVLMSLFIFAGSMQFVAVNLLLSAFDPLQTFLLTLLVNARHLFYGLSLLDKYKNTGFKKIYLIFGLCDETFSVTCSATAADGIDKGWFMFFVTLLNHSYWIIGTAIGALIGYLISFDLQGIEFVMTALFAVIFINQWHEVKRHFPALCGLTCSLFCLLVFGPEQFMIPAMIAIIISLSLPKAKSVKGAAK